MIDWNWFFSSVAQSVAALVGIVGAFLISRLLNSEASHARARARTQELLRDADNLSDAVKARFFDWYNERTLETSLKEVDEALREETDLLAAEGYYGRFFFPEYLPKAKCLEAIDDIIDEEVTRRGKERAKRQQAKLFGAPIMAEMPTFLNPTALAASRITGAAHRQIYEQEREAIRQVVLAVKGHVRAIREHLDGLEQAEPSTILRLSLLALLLLFWFGVIYPLSFLPVAATGPGTLKPAYFFDILYSLRGAILGLATAIFTGVIIFLVIRNELLAHPPEEVTALRKWLDPANYSDYLRIRLENGIPL